MTFFRAPPSSTPRTSSLVYTRNIDVINKLCHLSAVSAAYAATTLAVGSPAATSSAWLGPERTASLSSFYGEGFSSRTWESVSEVDTSIPLAALRKEWRPGIRGARCDQR